MAKFIITNHVFGNLTEYSIQNKETKEKVTIVSDFGCNTRELILKNGHELKDIIKGHNFASKLKKKYSTCAQLTPFVNRIQDGKYTFENMKYSLKINKENENNAIHGLVYDQIFHLKKRVIKKEYGSLVFEKKIARGEFRGYPFEISIQKQFTLTDNCGLITKTTITNIDRKNVPIGDGWHPYFSFDNQLIDEHKLLIPANRYFTNDERGIPLRNLKLPKTNNFKRLKQIGDKQFDTCFTELKFKDSIAETILSGLEYNIILWQSKEYPYLQIYTPKDRKSIAIEPMTSSADAFNNKNGLIVLKPGEEFTGEHGVYLVPKQN